MKKLITTLTSLAILVTPLVAFAGTANYYKGPCVDNDLMRGNVCINRDYLLIKQNNIIGSYRPRYDKRFRRWDMPTPRSIEQAVEDTYLENWAQRRRRQRLTEKLVPERERVRVIRVLHPDFIGNSRIRRENYVRTKRSIHEPLERIRIRR